jgi:flavin-binding protein dodecin
VTIDDQILTHPTERPLVRSSSSRGDGSQEDAMAIHKVIEVLSQSNKSWEDAAQLAVSDAGKTVKQIKSIYIKNMEGIVQNNRIVQYRVNANITFEVEE